MNVRWDDNKNTKIYKLYAIKGDLEILLADLGYESDVDDWEYTLYFADEHMFDCNWVFCKDKVEVEELKKLVEAKYLEYIKGYLDTYNNIYNILSTKNCG